MADSPLTDVQREVPELFFALPESDGFVLAGGAALVATGFSEQPTQDVDLFGSDLTAGVTAAADAGRCAFVVDGDVRGGNGTSVFVSRSNVHVTGSVCYHETGKIEACQDRGTLFPDICTSRSISR